MTHDLFLLTLLFLALLGAMAWPLGAHMARLFSGTYAWQPRLEAGLLRLLRLNGNDMRWTVYALGVLLFNLIGLLVLYGLQRLQGGLPFNPQGFGAVSADSAFNTAISFVTNTNWQGYAGESTMSHGVQMLGLTVQNFLSAATGIVVAIALMRGFALRAAAGLGNVWLDLLRAVLGVLLPLSLLLALALAGLGVVQSLDAHVTVALHGTPGSTQTLPLGPVASQEAIKLLGTNGGGFFNANSAHPFENPSALTNLLEMLAIFLVPAALCFAFGRLVGDRRQGWTLLAAMTLLFLIMLAVFFAAESSANPLLTALGVDGHAGNLEGKELRFGLAGSSLFAVVTTAASCGAVNAMHDSLMPLAGLVTLLQMQLGEVIFGGVGSGFYGMLLFAVVAVFVAGLMIGRTPEYLVKKIQSFDIRMTMLALLATPLLVLAGTALSVVLPAGLAGPANPGAHGFSEVLYAFSSAANNNGSAFAGLSANTPFYNTLLGLAMWFGRFLVIVPVLALAGSLAAKKAVPVTSGTLRTDTGLFVGLLMGAVLIVGALTYLPALALGPIAEHLTLFGIH